MLVFASGCYLGVSAQGDLRMQQGLRFYEKLAQRDADYEQSLQLLSNQDEVDYWMDQRNYERHLGKANFTSYLVYMKGKKDAYNEHLQTCDHKTPHSDLYLEKAKEYLSLSDLEFSLGQNSRKVVLSSSIRKK